MNIISKTNDNGKNLIIEYRLNLVNAFFFEGKNFFYALTDKDIALSLPYENNDCHGTFFGDKKYLQKHLLKEYNFSI